VAGGSFSGIAPTSPAAHKCCILISSFAENVDILGELKSRIGLPAAHKNTSHPSTGSLAYTSPFTQGSLSQNAFYLYLLLAIFLIG
ncbi:MAG: hypothetical protein IJY22_04965, partial [Clostridia bacterium]|nr:hypothetical protein [Clostridia bacterium]